MRHNRLPLKHSVEKKWEGGGRRGEERGRGRKPNYVACSA